MGRRGRIVPTVVAAVSVAVFCGLGVVELASTPGGARRGATATKPAASPSASPTLDPQVSVAEGAGAFTVSLPAAKAKSTETATPAAGAESTDGNGIEPLVCDGCAPPLKDYGGPVMGTPGKPGAVTISSIYWAPPGYPIPASYRSMVNGFVANLAKANASTTDIFSVDTEYSGIANAISDGGSFTDTAPYPRSTCTTHPGYRACVTDADLRAQINAVVAANHLPAGLANFYPIFVPPGVQIAWTQDGIRSGEDVCAYHFSYVAPSGARVVYAAEPYGSICSNGQAPNGNAAADTQVDTLSHEIVEAITDPLTKEVSWLDAKEANENGDMCNGNYGPPLGSTNPASPDTSRYTQVINGGRYYIQTSFSNAAFALDPRHGCVKGEAQVAAMRASGDPPTLNTVLVDPGSDALPAGGSTTVTATVLDGTGSTVAGDDVTFLTGTEDGVAGRCGTLSAAPGDVVYTNGTGVVTATYQGAGANDACVIEALEGATGQSGSAVIAEGAAGAEEPAISSSVQPSVVPGGAAAVITATVANPSARSIASPTLGVVLSGDYAGGSGVLSSRVHLSYADAATGGSYLPVGVTGTTVGGDRIGAQIPLGHALAAKAQVQVTIDLSLDGGPPLSVATGRPLGVGLDLEQISLTDGSVTVLASDTGSTRVQTSLAPLLDNVLGVVSNVGSRLGVPPHN